MLSFDHLTQRQEVPGSIPDSATDFSLVENYFTVCMDCIFLCCSVLSHVLYCDVLGGGPPYVVQTVFLHQRSLTCKSFGTIHKLRHTLRGRGSTKCDIVGQGGGRDPKFCDITFQK